MVLSLLVIASFSPIIIMQTSVLSRNEVLIANGSVINITSGSERMISGLPAMPSYYGGHISFNLSSCANIVGSWTSTSNSTIWVSGVDWVWMETPVPGATNGSLNMSLTPGKYVLTYGVFPGDTISVISSMELLPLMIHSISSLKIRQGSIVDALSGSVVYNFTISQPGTIVGSFKTSGPYYITVYSKSGSGFSVSDPIGYPHLSCGLNVQLAAGTYQIIFDESLFMITETTQVVNFNQY